MTTVETRLAGKTVLVTRPKAQSGGMKVRLEALGAKVVEMPAIEILPLGDYREFDRTLNHLDSFDWIVLTSVNGVRFVAERMTALGIPKENLANRMLAAIGPATAEALAEICRYPDLVPSEFVAEALGEQLPVQAGQRVLLARADIARKELAEMLRARGAVVNELTVYRIVRSNDAPAFIERPDYITLTSSATARATLDLLESQANSAWMREARIVCIGPITAATVAEMGFAVAGVAHAYTVDGLVEKLIELEEANV